MLQRQFGPATTAWSSGSCRVNGDSTPTMSVPPVVYCKTGTTCTVSVPAGDDDRSDDRPRQKTVRVRIADAAGNVSDWFVVPVSRLR